MKDNHSSKHEGTKSQKEKPDTDIGTGQRIALDLSHRLRQEHQGERAEDKAQSNKQLGWTMVTAGLVLIYTLVMIWQAWLTRDIAHSSNNQLVYSQRAWIGFPGGVRRSPNDPPIGIGSIADIALIVRNFGHSPATKSSGAVMEQIICGKFPYDPPYLTKGNDLNIKSSGTIMPEQEQGLGPATLEHPITTEEMQSLFSQKCGLYAWAKVEYCDIFRIRHYQHFCQQWMYPLSTSNWAGCPKYNDGDQDYPDRPPESCPK